MMAGPFDAILRDARRPTVPAKLPGRNEPCWCGSKVKFKKCHLGRETQPRGDVFDFTKRTDKASKRGVCLYPMPGGSCGKTAISSHTVQRRGGLTAIAENGHVLTTMLNFVDLAKSGSNLKLRKVGLKEASTFPGFCPDHDSSVFRLIEGKDITPSQEAGFLFYYRALSMELVRKLQALATAEGLATLDAGMPVHRQLRLQSMVSAATTGLRIGISELERHKTQADAMLMASNWQSVQHCFVKFDSVIPLVTAFAIQHEHDWQGVRLQDLGNLSHNMEVVSITVTSYNGVSWAIFAWLDNSTTALQFVESFLRLDKADMAGRIVSVCFDLAENNYVDPRWWRAISMETRKVLSGQIMSGIQQLHSAEGMQFQAELTQPVTATGVYRSAN